ncbi:phage tail protein [Erythrobacter tepidarius]|uniref:phage tail protein n=1 Tax=Erythrobacter tepidarius TaxID=60454 RepID=UPI000A39B73B|nr:phage tail protein [Erythrobacter tepidarius]
MGKVVRAIVGAGLVVVGAVTGNFQLILAGVSLVGGALLQPSVNRNRAAAAAQLQLGEQPRQAIFGRAAVGGSLVDAFNYGGKYGTDWEVLVIALADHRCDALEGFFVDDAYVAFAGDGNVAGFNNQLQVFWRDGQWDQTVPSILTANGPGWTANDRGRGVAYVVVAYKADKADAKNPVWPSGRPRFRWVVRGLRCYQPRKDSTVGGSGAHRRDNPATWEWTENPIDIRYNWVRGIYAGDLVDQPGMLLLGRGLSAIEAPPANVFSRANLCDELVGGQPRYRVGGVVAANEPFIDVESDFAAAVAGTISQPQGAVEVDPGQAKAPVAHFTDDDLLIGSTVRWNEGILGAADEGWVNTVAPRFIDPAQRWTVRSAPVQRDLADVTADGGPREQQPQLDFVTDGAQAQRIGQIIRRLGRLWGRATVTLPPRFAFIEEGDWVTWQSNRRFGGATLTFRVEAWGSDKAWHHQLTLRQISASAFSDTAPLDDGSIASDQPEPPVVAAPGVGAWSAAAVLLGAGSVRIPNLRVGGATDDPAASLVVFEYIQQVEAPGVGSIWTFAASSRPEVTLLDIPVPEGGTFWVAVSYIVDGIQGERRVLGPISTSGLSFSDGSPVAPVAPANANRVPFSRMEGDRGYAVLHNPVPLSIATDYNANSIGIRFFRGSTTITAAGQQFSIGNSSRSAVKVTPGERLSVQARVSRQGTAAGTWQLELWTYQADGVTGSGTVIASGTGLTSLGDGIQRGFVTVPSGRYFARFELRFISTAAGTAQIAIAEPMVTEAAPDQSVHPSFSPGPNAVDGADVTGENVAAAITGQSAWATTTIPTSRLDYLDNSGNLSSLDRVTTRNLNQLNNRAWTNLYRADGTTPITDADAITSLGTAAAITGQGALATANSVNYATQVVGSGRPETFVFGCRGNSATAPTGYSEGLFDGAGNSIGGFVRSYRVFYRTFGSTTWVTQGFDVFGTAGQDTAMANYLNAIPTGAVVVVLSFDEPKGNRLGGGLPNAMYRCGASRSVFGRNNFAFRSAYALIGRAGIGEGMGTEYYRGDGDNDPNAWISGTFTIVNGVPITGLTPIRGAQDIAYPNGVRLDELQPSEAGANITETRVAAAITGQSPWATTAIPTSRVNNLDNSGNLSSLANITTRNLNQLNNRAWTNLYRADGTTPITDADAITSLGTAAAITGQGALATLNNIDAGGPYFVGTLPVERADVALRNENLALGNANRVPFSRMEGDRGWAVLFNPVPMAFTTSFGTFAGMRFFRVDATATAAGQIISIGNAGAAGPIFRLTPGERVSVQVRTEAQGPAANGWRLSLWGYRADGTADRIAEHFGANRQIGDGFIQFFSDVPSDMIGGWLELYVYSSAAGSLVAAISEPMVTEAAPGQGVHPSFSPGPNAEDGADVTATAQRTIVPQFPVIEIKQGEAGHTGNRTVTHTAKRGTATLTGGTWSLPSQNLGAGSASINSSTGTVTLSGIVQSGAYAIRYTHSDGFATEINVNVTFVPLVAAGVGNTANSITKPFSSTSFTAISNEMTIALPSGVTVANLLANGITLEVPNSFPAGVTNVEVKWQRETSPGTWADVGSVATSSPHPGVIDEGGFPSAEIGFVTCNRTATGLTAGSTQKFRLMARISGGQTRTVTPFGTVTAGG